MAVFLFGLMQVQAVACVGGEVVTTDDSNSEEVNYYAGTAIPLGVNPFDYDGIRAMNTGSPDYSAVDVNKLVVSNVKGYHSSRANRQRCHVRRGLCDYDAWRFRADRDSP